MLPPEDGLSRLLEAVRAVMSYNVGEAWRRGWSSLVKQFGVFCVSVRDTSLS